MLKYLKKLRRFRMTKKEIMNDIKFRQRCGKYGLDWEKFNLIYL